VAVKYDWLAELMIKAIERVGGKVDRRRLWIALPGPKFNVIGAVKFLVVHYGYELVWF
jgi:hypothetical protein